MRQQETLALLPQAIHSWDTGGYTYISWRAAAARQYYCYERDTLNAIGHYMNRSCFRGHCVAVSGSALIGLDRVCKPHKQYAITGVFGQIVSTPRSFEENRAISWPTRARPGAHRSLQTYLACLASSSSDRYLGALLPLQMRGRSLSIRYQMWS